MFQLEPAAPTEDMPFSFGGGDNADTEASPAGGAIFSMFGGEGSAATDQRSELNFMFGGGEHTATKGDDDSATFSLF